jgi:hypothetical protein
MKLGISEAVRRIIPKLFAAADATESDPSLRSRMTGKGQSKWLCLEISPLAAVINPLNHSEARMLRFH